MEHYEAKDREYHPAVYLT